MTGLKSAISPEQSEESPEYQTMTACTPDLTTILALDPVTISEHLLAKGLIPRTLHSRLVQSGDALHDKAQRLVDTMTTCVQAKASNFTVLIAILKKQGGWTSNIVSILKETYQSKL